MSDIFGSPAVQAGIGLLVLCILIAGSFYLLASFRDYAAKDQETAGDVLANLREMHRKGDISDEEFRTIEATAERQSTRTGSIDEDASQTDESP